MQEIVQFLKGFGDFFVSIGQFVVDFFGDIAELAKLVVVAGRNYLSFINGWLPIPLLICFVNVISIAILFRVLGRE